jgi:CHAT domain-containing protein
MVLGALLAAACAAAAQPVPNEDDAAVAARATALTRRADRLCEEGRLAEALPLAEQALRLRRQLYPPDRYPQGHAALAQGLNLVGALHEARGEHTEALRHHREALAMYRKLYPPERYPEGHAALLVSLTNMGLLFSARGEHAEALGCHREALAMGRRLYPPESYPRGHRFLAGSLSNLGLVLKAQGDYAEALRCYREALQVFQGLYPAGHSDLATILDNLGELLHTQGEFAEALRHYRQALALYRRLYPADRYPAGHPDLAQSLNNLGSLLQERGEHAEAQRLLREALAMLRRLYPEARFPRGHPDLAACLGNLALLLRVQGEDAEALRCQREALAMVRKLYPAERFPSGHPLLARGLGNLATLLVLRREHGEALRCYREALAVCRRLYPPERHPQGHADLATYLANLGLLQEMRGEHGEALRSYREAAQMSQRLLAAFAGAAGEAQALNYLAQLPAAEHGLLTAALHAGTDAGATYAALWRHKAALAQALRGRQQALGSADPETRALAARLLQTRRELATLLLAPPAGTDRGERLRQLTQAREDLEARLAQRLPALKRQRELERLAPADLVRLLPPGSAVVELFRYRRQGQPGTADAWHYTAFMLQHGRPVERIELGTAGPPEQALRRWRQALQAGEEGSAAAAEVRRLLWVPLARKLAAGTGPVYVCPDGALAGLPWAALPLTPLPPGERGRGEGGTVLLEEHAVAVLPHVPLLLEQLAPGADGARAGGVLLAVGGVDYDRAEAVGGRPPADRPKTGRGPVILEVPSPLWAGDKRPAWPALPATDRERRRVLALAEGAGLKGAVSRAGAAADTDQVLADLPRARWVHLATHGFFADACFRSALEHSEKEFAPEVLGGRERRFAAGARSPLALSGLVLAGANRRGKEAPADGGVLTAEAIAGLDLAGLELAVLSACETGLGEVAGGEGVFGLQRAFHLAGARNVVASLWKVDDEATAALMGLFYHHLWIEKKTPLEALRQAQVTLYHHPERIAPLARLRGPDFEKTARLPPARGAASARRAPARLWAGFVLSGAGR